MKNVIVVGSGAGGATITRELAIKGYKVTLLEKGPETSPVNSFKHYNLYDSGVEISNTECIGGTTMVTVGNAVRTSQELLQKKFNINLEKEFKEAESELGVNTLPDTHFGIGTKKIMDSASDLGFNIQKMPKFIKPELCKPCGKCALGCSRNAKWTSQRYLEEAVAHGARIIPNSSVSSIIKKNGLVKGVKTFNKTFMADLVVLCAGAIETPRILQKINLKAGNNLFVDTFVTIGGVIPQIAFHEEVPMNALIVRDKYILGPHYSSILAEKLPEYNPEDILGIMVKIADESSGQVTPTEVIKHSTLQDIGVLSEGTATAGAILIHAGVDPKTIVSTPGRGAHPGGTAAIGQIVDENLQTDIEGLYVADASVFPQAPGAPPILTIVALAKKLGNYLTTKS